MSYIPNFADARVKKRIHKALAFSLAVFSETRSHPWSTRFIDRYFGSQRNDLSKYLRKTLLICTDEFYRYNSQENKCKEYKLNKSGVEYLQKMLELDATTIYPSVVDIANQDHNTELISGNFQYSDKNYRLWHPLQKYRRNYRSQILSHAGYQHDYDIQCCAPTLIYQYAQHLGMDEYLFSLKDYLSDKTSIRARLAQSLELYDNQELDTRGAKEIINALFCGARISNNEYSDIYAILGGDSARIRYLQQDPFINQLQSDIRTCWDYISPQIPRKRKTDTNRLIPISCRDRWNVYFELERQILNSIRNYLHQQGIRYFLMHDGWSCDQEIDQEELSNHVRNQTGFDLNFDYTNIKGGELHSPVIGS